MFSMLARKLKCQVLGLDLMDEQHSSPLLLGRVGLSPTRTAILS